MPRKITDNVLKDRRDLCMMKIRLNQHSMKETNDKYSNTIAELEAREQHRQEILMKTLFDAAIPYFGINITPEELIEKFKWIMDSERNKGAVKILAQLEEKRVEQIEVAEAKRIQELRKNHSSLFKKIDELDGKNTVETQSEVSPISESEAVMEEPTENEINEGYYMSESEETYPGEYTE